MDDIRRFPVLIDLPDYKLRVIAYSKKNAPDILSDQSHEQQVDARKETDGSHHGRPSKRRQRTDDLPDHGKQRKKYAYPGKNIAEFLNV